MVQKAFLALILVLGCAVLSGQIIDSLNVAAEDSLKTVVPIEDIVKWYGSGLGTAPREGTFLEQTNHHVNSLNTYGAAYHAYGLEAQNIGFEYHDFESIPGVFGSNLYLRNYADFFSQQVSGRILRFDNEHYDFPVLLTELNAGMGDYEYNYVNLALRKNEILSLPWLYYAGDFLGQKGYWTGVDHNQSAQKQYISARMGKFLLEAEYASWALDASSQDLLPEYWQTTNFSIDHKLRKLYAGLRSPWLDLSVLNTRETGKAAVRGMAYSAKTTQIKAGKSFELGDHFLGAKYEHAFSEINKSSLATWGGRLYEDLIGLDYRYDSSGIKALLKAKLYDWEDSSLEGDLSYGGERWRIGGDLALGDSDTYASHHDLYSSAGTVIGVHQLMRKEYAMYASVDPSKRSSVEAKAGTREFQMSDASIDDYRESIPFAETSFIYRPNWGKLSLDACQILNWQSTGDVLYNLPELSYRTQMELKLDTGYENKVFAGFSFIGHSGFRLAEATATEIGGSGILDLWVGVGITKLFDLTLMMKNVGDNDIYGAYTIPRTLHAGIRWVYLD